MLSFRAFHQLFPCFNRNTKIERSALKLKSKYETMKRTTRCQILQLKEGKQSEKSIKSSKESKGETKTESKPDQLDAREVIKKEAQADQDNTEADQVMSKVDRCKSETDHDMIMPEATDEPINQNESPPELKPDVPKIQLPKVAENDLKEMREFLQQNKNVSQGGLQIASATSIAQTLETEEISASCSNANNCDPNVQSNDFHVSQKTVATQCNYYRSTDVRAQQKHSAELRNLELQHQILEIELKIKQRELAKSTNE